MSKKNISWKRDNLFTIFIVIIGIAVIAAVALMSNQEELTSDNKTEEVVNSNTNAAEVLNGSGGYEIEDSEVNNNTEVVVENINQESSSNTNKLVVEDELDDLELLANATYSKSDEIETYRFGGDNIVNVMPLSYESLIMSETPIVGRQLFLVSGYKGELLTIKSAKDGSELEILQVKTDNNLYDIRGDKDFLNNINNYIEINN